MVMRGVPVKSRRRQSPRRHELTVRLGEDELERLREFARLAGFSMAEYVRTLLLQGGGCVEDPPKTSRQRRTALVADPALLYQVARIGNNLNQISRRVNSSERGKGLDVQVLLSLISIERALSSLFSGEGKPPGEKGLRASSESPFPKATDNAH